MRVLITGGAGFIGRYAARLCLARGDTVTVLDNFSPQIHGFRPASEIEQDFRQFLSAPPHSPADNLNVFSGDVRDINILERALEGQDAVIHLAAETGTGQSMYEVVRYEQVNIGGTAALVQCLTTGRFPTIRKLVLASSRAIYGEGKYICDKCGIVYPHMRTAETLKLRQFEPRCPSCHASCRVAPTDETSPAAPASFYGLTKQVQEEMIRLFASTLGLSAFILRYQNVYGPGQSLRNPYTGILAIFSNRARAHEVINIFEDGQESRDFVYVEDVAWATRRCLDSDLNGIHTLNVGSGESVTIEQVASQIKAYFRSECQLRVSGQFRLGDIRHNLADLSRVRSVLGYEPQVKFEDGIRQFLNWAETQPIETDRYEQSIQEMGQRGMAGISES
jgi:dTDP-L-rhamnose 4-epimerase